jgi:hypothetical protein
MDLGALSISISEALDAPPTAPWIRPGLDDLRLGGNGE